MAHRQQAETILVVEDDPSLQDALCYTLRREGFAPVPATDGLSALESARAHRPDLVILDLMLPKLDGLEVCRILRKKSDVPILMLTARDQEIDKVVGLELGADDYIVKPFSMRELVARIRSHLRRARQARELAAEPPLAEERLRLGPLEVDLSGRRVFRHGKEVDLRPKEFDLLAFFVANRGRVLTRDVLLSNVWGYEFSGASRTVDVHVRWLREKIEEEPSHPTLVRTVRGVGYRFQG